MTLELTDMIELNDSDELLREIDRRVEQRNWAGVLELRDRCHLAVDRGKQLWGVAAHAEYRLALQAPAEFAGPVVDARPGRFALGPLPEVAASAHSWHELRPHVNEGPVRGVTAYECVVRGEDLSGEADLQHHVAMFEIPLALQDWEPDYPVARYKSSGGVFDRPLVTPLETVSPSKRTCPAHDDRDVQDTLADLARNWVDGSNGRAMVVGVEGDGPGAVRALEVPAPELLRIGAADALALMAWCAASGGAHGRRSGMAAGRLKAWWAAITVAGIGDVWPVASDDLGEAAEALDWFTWSPSESSTGWSLRLAVSDPSRNVAFAIDAHDSSEI